MKFNINCKKGQGNSLGFFLRSLVLRSTPCWRPIAFNIVDKATNTLFSDGAIIEDMITFSRNLSSIFYVSDSKDDLVVETYTFKGVLTKDKLAEGKVVKAYKSTGKDEILHVANDVEVTVKVYFRKASGEYSINDNNNFLSENLPNINCLNILTSVHSVSKSFEFSVKESFGDNEVLNIGMTNIIENEKDVLYENIERAIKVLENVKEQIN